MTMRIASILLNLSFRRKVRKSNGMLMNTKLGRLRMHDRDVRLARVGYISIIWCGGRTTNI